jgi:hypothetical protein
MKLKAVEYYLGIQKNPIYVWKIMHIIRYFCEGSTEHGRLGLNLTIKPPAWCLDYFVSAASRIDALSYRYDLREEMPTLRDLDPRECVDALPAVLGFVRPGWNSFNEITSIRESRWMVKRVNELRDEGLSYEKATEQTAEYYGYVDVRSFRRRIADFLNVHTDRRGLDQDET